MTACHGVYPPYCYRRQGRGNAQLPHMTRGSCIVLGHGDYLRYRQREALAAVRGLSPLPPQTSPHSIFRTVFENSLFAHYFLTNPSLLILFLAVLATRGLRLETRNRSDWRSGFRCVRIFSTDAKCSMPDLRGRHIEAGCRRPVIRATHDAEVGVFA